MSGGEVPDQGADTDVDGSDECGYRLEIGVIQDAFPAAPCERPVWEDHDRCVWHATVDGKKRETLENARSEAEDNFNGAYLREAELLDIDWLADTSLVGADLTGANIKGADLSGADLTFATLTDASALSADFSGANLEGAILTNADFRQATLKGARLHQTVLTDLHVGGGTDMGNTTVYDQERSKTSRSKRQRGSTANCRSCTGTTALRR